MTVFLIRSTVLLRGSEMMFGHIIAAILYYWVPRELRDTDFSGMGES